MTRLRITYDSAVSTQLLTTIFFPEFVGTFFLMLLGCGAVANATLPKTKGTGGGSLTIYLGWGIAVLVGVYAAHTSGGQLNPAITIGLVANHLVSGQHVLTLVQVLTYIVAQLAGAFTGASACWVIYRQHFNLETDPAVTLNVFCTFPAIRSFGQNFLTEVIATTVLVFWCTMPGLPQGPLRPVIVAVLIVGIGAGLGGPTSYAINPARDLGPRLAHALWPITHKGSSDWHYAWIPVLGPLAGGIIGGLLSGFFR